MTVIELMFTIALLGIVVAVLASSFLSVQRSEAYVQDRSASLDDMRVSMSRLTRDLRQGAAFVGTPTSSHFAVQTYLDGVLHQVTYDASGTTLTRAVDGNSAVVVQRRLADTDVFQYAPDASTAQVVTITLSVVPAGAPTTTVSLESEVRLRNLTEAQ
jgi:Tfp pilus assembly protein PilW